MNAQARLVFNSMMGLGLLIGLYEGTLFYLGYELGYELQTAWNVVAALLLGTWVEADSRNRPNVYRPFDLGWFVVLFAIPYLPYYLLKTRGAAGILWLLGMVAVLWLGFWLEWLIYLTG